LNYRQQVLEAYMNALITSGASEQTITIALMGFETGFAAGVLMNDDDDYKKEMINNLTYIKEIH
jgi:hypothetical protein